MPTPLGVPMVIFELIKHVLDRYYKHPNCPGSDAEKDAQIQKASGQLAGHLGTLLYAEGGPDYTQVTTRMAYVHRYVAAHANFLCQVLSECGDFRSSICGLPTLRVHAIGGGPGSDLLGVVKYLLQQGLAPDLVFRTFDRVPDWHHLGEHFVSLCAPLYQRHGAGLSCSLTLHDPVKPLTWQRDAGHLQADLFTLMFSVCELTKTGEAGQRYLRNLFSGAPSGAWFVLLDNDGSSARAFWRWLDQTIDGIELEEMLRREDVELKIADHKQEEKGILADYNQRFSVTPRLRGRVGYRILRRAAC